MRDPDTADIRNALLQVLVHQYAQRQALEEMRGQLEANVKRERAKASANLAVDLLLAFVVIIYLIILTGGPL